MPVPYILNSLAHKPLLIVVSGPAGSGKTTLCDRLLAEFPDKIKRIITATTRPPRPGETDNVDYHFLSPGDFLRRVEIGDFYEWAKVHGHYYGTLKSEVREPLYQGLDVLLNVDVQGASAWREQTRADHTFPGVLLTVFVTPPTMDELRRRLEGRGKDSADVIEERLLNARHEIEQLLTYDYCVMSADREHDYQRVRAVYMAEKLRVRVRS
jgi:guanylate kinase